MALKNYVIGMDGGGTKTDVLILDTDYCVSDSFTGGTVNYNGESGTKVDANLAAIFLALRKKGFRQEDCAAICIGAAGISNPAVPKQLRENISRAGFACPVRIAGDHEAAFAGALEKPYGIILIAGTGSVCYGTDREGRSCRTGGYGHLIDDAGSGYAIARDILSCVVQAYDKRSEPTVLTELVFEYLKLDTMNDLISYVYHPDRNKKEIAALSVLIEAACDRGDRRAMQLLEKNAGDLAALASPVIEQVGEDTELAVTGSVLLGNKDIYREFKSRLEIRSPRVRVMKPRNTAAYGAALLALQLIGGAGDGKP
jgi:N-acetylglucosamine kinase-like BadF-type ATPase